MLTFKRAKKSSAMRPAARAGAAVLLSAAALALLHNPAKADDVMSGGCLGSWTTFSCVTTWGATGNTFVRLVPQPSDDAARNRAAERDRHWTDRCHPSIKPDRYGVGRYEYSEAGCEFGTGETQ